jgi:hypothetical protein
MVSRCHAADSKCVDLDCRRGMYIHKVRGHRTDQNFFARQKPCCHNASKSCCAGHDVANQIKACWDRTRADHRISANRHKARARLGDYVTKRRSSFHREGFKQKLVVHWLMFGTLSAQKQRFLAR